MYFQLIMVEEVYKLLIVCWEEDYKLNNFHRLIITIGDARASANRLT
jgi:hypothetical protein